MSVNIPVNRTDAIILVILAVLFILGIRIVFGFFKKPEKSPDTAEQIYGSSTADNGVKNSVNNECQ